MLYVIINFNSIGQKSLQDKKVSSMREMGEKDENFSRQKFLAIYIYILLWYHGYRS